MIEYVFGLVWVWAGRGIALWTLAGVLNLAIFYPLFLKFVARSKMDNDEVGWVIFFGPLTTIFCILAYFFKSLSLGLNMLEEIPTLINRLYRLDRK